MDPTTCYQMILDYLETHDHAEARTSAAILQNWLANRGFYPENQRPARVDEVLDYLLRPACAPRAIAPCWVICETK